MRTGDLVFVRGHSFISKIILFFDKGPKQFTHVAMATSLDDITEAQRFQKTRIIPMKYKDYEVLSLHLTVDEQVACLEAIGELFGRKYDYKQIWWDIIHFFFHKKAVNPSNDAKRMVCTEYMARILVKAGIIQPFDGLYDMKPNQFYDYMEQFVINRRPA